MLPHLVVIQSSQLHEKVMGMLTVHDGTAKSGFTLLEKLRIAPVRNRSRLEAEHGPEGQSALAEFSLGHRHPPVGRK
jgi:hypothetical protein